MVCTVSYLEMYYFSLIVHVNIFIFDIWTIFVPKSLKTKKDLLMLPGLYLFDIRFDCCCSSWVFQIAEHSGVEFGQKM